MGLRITGKHYSEAPLQGIKDAGIKIQGALSLVSPKS